MEKIENDPCKRNVLPTVCFSLAVFANIDVQDPPLRFFVSALPLLVPSLRTSSSPLMDELTRQKDG
ncbi:hypothetical protein WN51_06342 [Melipona quadrifasciata]|uniref:Uncharacterized protein n=1 Tax=Melipona quadrifasciata TaxID=166423 RepID=A0A0M8ZTG5_9HYME|nr:hypothetical protein WN51_06342 [Melipona quadrifasciata]